MHAASNKPTLAQPLLWRRTFLSDSLGANLVWTRTTLDAFLAAPTRYIPGTAMGYTGIADAAERRDLIAYLAAVSQNPTRCAAAPKEAQP